LHATLTDKWEVAAQAPCDWPQFSTAIDRAVWPIEKHLVEPLIYIKQARSSSLRLFGGARGRSVPHRRKAAEAALPS